MKTLSLCGGIETGLHALKKAKIKITRYESVEIDRHARLVADYNSNGVITRRFHCVYQYAEHLEKHPNEKLDIDLVLLGFTCSSLTVQGKREGLSGESGIIYPAIDIIKFIRKQNPDVKFLIENVSSMSNENKELLNSLIFKELGVKFHRISSALYSGQDRDRLYWTNIEFSLAPSKKNTSANSVLEEDGLKIKAWSKSSRYKCQETGRIFSNPGEGRERYYEHRLRKDVKSNTLVTGDGCQGPSTKNIVVTKSGEERPLTVLECSRLQTLPKNFDFSIVNKAKAYKMIGLGWTLEVIYQILKGLKSKERAKSGE